ncbi:unnamed protein product [Coregonus sp. 'balchen']|nr:unnamed protein product [Coregonus sp. 'balchen']
MSVQYEEPALAGSYGVYFGISRTRQVTVNQGLRRSGKSSIRKSANKIYKDDISSSSFVNFQIWDLPGTVDFDPTFNYEMIFREGFVFILSWFHQDDYVEAWEGFISVSGAYRFNPEINFEVFLSISFYLTSIYDHSIFEAFSKNSGIEKGFLFDVVSKIYITTDSSAVT